MSQVWLVIEPDPRTRRVRRVFLHDLPFELPFRVTGGWLVSPREYVERLESIE